MRQNVIRLNMEVNHRRQAVAVILHNRYRHCSYHETKQKNWQGGIDTKENQSEKRMYAVNGADDKCPVRSLKYFLSKTDPNATSLFNCCSKPALGSPQTEEIWYTTVPLKHYNFTRFMSDICKHSNVAPYTAHCLRATAIQGMNDAGVRNTPYHAHERTQKRSIREKLQSGLFNSTEKNTE